MRNEVAPVPLLSIQRERLLTAAVKAIEQDGYAALTVAQIVRRANVSRKTFYELFDNRDDCFSAAFEQAIAQARIPMQAAYEREGDWRTGMRSGLFELLALMEEHPGLARLCVVEPFAAGEHVLRCRLSVLDELAEVVGRGRRFVKDGDGPADLAAEAVVGGALAVLHRRLVTDERQRLVDLLGPLMSMIVLPYLGTTVANCELTNGAQSTARVLSEPSGDDPLAGLKLRLTYRTVRVLMVIGEDPGISNRSVAERSGVLDEGQVSKLLSRLARLDLVENRGAGQPKGGANEWYLTARGAALERATRPSATTRSQ